MRRIFGWMVVCLVVVLVLGGGSVGGDAANAAPAVRPLGDSYVLIDKSENRLTYYFHGQEMRTFVVGTGKNPGDTPTGVFPVVMKVRNPWYLKSNIPGGDPHNPLGIRWIGLEVPGKGKDGSRYGIHGTNRPESIGGHVSAGCVRMLNEEVAWLYEHVRIGTLVEIVE